MMKKLLILFTISFFATEFSFAQTPVRAGRDCADAVWLCSSTEIVYDTINGCSEDSICIGPNDDALNVVCWNSTEIYPFWYQFTAANDGVFQMAITPKFPTGLPNNLKDFKWAIFDVTAGCASKTMVSCNSSLDCGNTGISTDSLANPKCNSGPQTSKWNSNLNLLTNHTYAIYIDYMYVFPGISYTLQFNMSNLASQVQFQDIDVSFSTGGAATCFGSSFSFTNTSTGPGFSTADYTWDFGDGTTLDTGFVNVNHTYATPGTYKVKLTAISGACNGADSVMVTVNSNPNVSVGNDTAVCGNTSLLLSSTVSGGTPGYTYSWSPSTGLNNAAIPNPTANVTANITYILSVSDSKGCSDKDTIVITYNTIPVITTTQTNATCGLQDGSATAIPGAGSYNYNWNSTPPQFTATATGLAAGVYTVTVTNTATGCSDTAMVRILDSNPPVANAGADATICFGSSTTLNGTASGGVSPYTYSWTPVTGLATPNSASTIASPTTTTTYTLTVTDINNCTASDNVRITVNPQPTINLSSTTSSMCLGDSTLITASGASTYTWSPATGLSATTGSSVIATPSSTTTYTVTGTDVNGCTNTQTITITVNPLPTVSINPPSGSICAGQSITLTASGATTYTWLPGGMTGPSVTVSPSTSTNYYVTGNNGVCSNKDTVLVTVSPLPSISISPSSASMCIGSPVSLTASGASSYTWAPATGLSSTSGATVTANPASTTTYTVTGTSAASCTNTQSVTVTVNPLPTITINPATPSICVGSSVTLNASGASTYTWSPATGLSSVTGNSVIANPAVTTTYTVTGTDVNGCINSTTVTVTVNPLPVVNINPTSAIICRGASTNLTASGANTYTWSPATGLNTTTGPTVTASPNVTTTYTVTGTGANGCSSTKTVTVTVRALPAITINPATPTICRGSSVSLTASGAVSYTWNPGGMSGATVNVSPNATTTYTVTGTGANGCTGTRTVVVTVRNLPTVSISPASTAICEGGSANLTGSGATNYTWAPGGLSGTTVSVNPASTTTYTVTGTDANGCSNTATSTVTVNPKPVLSISTTNALCGATNGSATVSTGAGSFNYTWNSTPAQFTPTASNLAAGSYIVTVTNTTTGCSNTATAVVSNPPSATTDAGLDDTICSGNSTTLNGSVSGGQTPYTIVWSPATGLSSTSSLTPTANPSVATKYILSVTDGNNCLSTDSVTITVNNPDVVTAASDTICEGESAMLIAGGGVLYTWSPATGLNSTSNDTVMASPSSTTTYTITIQDAIGCSDTDSIKIVVLPIPVTEVSPASSALCIGESVTLNASGALTYSWSPATGLSATTGTSVSANPLVSTTYYVTGTGANGCTSTDSTVITINPLPDINVSVSDTLLCNGSTSTMTASGASSYTWSPASGLSAVTGSTVVASPSANTTYTVIGLDANGCADTTTVDIMVNQLPPINISPVSAEICEGSSTVVTASGALNYTWSPATGLSATTGASVTANPSVSTTYTVIGSDANGCTDTSTVFVKVNPLPTVSVTGSDTILCPSEASVLIATGAFTYTWVPVTGLSTTTGDTVNAMPVVTTVYTVTGTDTLGCSNSDSISIFVNPAPVVLISAANDSICIGQQVVLTATGATSYTWSPGAILSATTGSTVTTNPIVTSTIDVSGIDDNGCSGDTSITITVVPLPVLTLSTDNPIVCIGATVNLTATGATNYTWSPATFLSGTTGSSVSSVPLSDITYTVVGSNGFGCADSLSTSINVNPLPIITINASDTTLCMGDTAVLSASGGTSYFWSPATFISDPNSAVTSVFPTNSTTYIVTGVDANSCANSDSVLISVNPLPAVSFSGLTTPICMNTGTVTLTGTPAGGTFSGAGVSGNIFDPVSAGAGGPYAIVYSFTDANGCSNDTTQMVTVNTVPTASVSGIDDEYCNNFGVVVLTGSPIGGIFTVDGTQTTFFDTNTLSVGVHTVVYTYTDANSCTDDTTFSFTIRAIPVVSFSGLSNQYCINAASSTLTGTPAGGTFSGPGIVSGNVFDPSVAGAGSHSITYTFSDSFGCSNDSTIDVTVTPPPSINLGSIDTVMCINETSVTLSASPAGGTFSGTGVSGSIFDPSVAGIGTHVVTYTYTDAGSCTANASISIHVNSLPAVNANATDISCYGDANGSVILTGSSGLPPYSFSIDGTTFTASGTFGSLTSGNYTGTISDLNGCSNTVDFTINEPDSISAVITTVLPLNCTDTTGSITITSITGGNPSYLTNLNGGSFTSTTVYSNLGSGSYLVTIQDQNGCEKTYTTDVFSPTSIMASDSSADITCFGANNGMVMVYNITGSSRPYTFSIDNATYVSDSVFSNLSPGTYTLYIKGADGCISQYSYLITEPVEIDFSIVSKSNISCFGAANGSVDVTSSGGVPSYMYSLNGGSPQASPSFGGLVQGAYTVTVTDANGCSESLNFTIVEPDSISAVAATINPTLCTTADGTISLGSIAGGTRPFSFSIDGNTPQSDSVFTGLFSGTHLVVITDIMGCSKSYIITLTSPTQFNATVASTNILCNGSDNGTITVSNVSGGVSPYSFSLDNTTYTSSGAFSNLSAGIYTVFVRDNDLCITQYIVEITEPDSLKASIAVQNISCFGAGDGSVTINATGGTPSYTYSIDGTTYVSDSIFSGLGVNGYPVFVKDTNGCEVTASFTITEPDSIYAVVRNTRPANCTSASGEISISGIGGGTAPYTFAMDGGVPLTDTIITNAASGSHIITISDANGCTRDYSVSVNSTNTNFTAVVSTTPNICPLSYDAQITIRDAEGSSPPFRYSIDGINYFYDSTFYGLQGGTYIVTAADSNNCGFVLDTVTINHIDTVVVEISSTVKSMPFDSTAAFTIGLVTGGTPFVNTSGDPYYEFTISPFHADSFSTRTQYTDLKAGDYWLYVKDANGCIDSVQVSLGELVPIPPFIIPNVFTPNGDGTNDYFSILTLPSGSKLHVYNRWGNKVYQSDDYQNNWDAKGLTDGVYYYHLFVKFVYDDGSFSEKEFKGWVEVIK